MANRAVFELWHLKTMFKLSKHGFCTDALIGMYKPNVNL